MRTTVTQIGNSMGFIVPKEFLAALNLKKGAPIFLSRTNNGFSVTLYDPEVERQLEIAEKYAADYREVFKKLAD